MNIMAIIVLIVLVWKISQGFKRGMVKEIVSFVSLIILCAVATLIVKGLQSYMEKEILGVVIAVLLVVVVGIIHHLLGIVFFSAKMISKLPVISWVDKLLGMVAGVLEVVVILWMLYLLIMKAGLGGFGQKVMEYTAENPVLSWIYEYNPLAMWVEGILGKINF